MFSQRYGYKQYEEIRSEGISMKTRSRLWSGFFEKVYEPVLHCRHNDELAEEYDGIMKMILRDIMGMQSDILVLKGPAFWDETFKENFMKMAWYKLFDLIEFILLLDDEEICPNLHRVGLIHSFKEECDRVFRTENSVYRIAGCQIVKNLSEQEIKEIERAIDSNGERGLAAAQLSKAVGFLFNRESPDYENCAKEAILSVETLLRQIGNTDKGTIGELLKMKIISGRLHPSIIKAIDGLHGYCSDASGVRHAASDSEVKAVTEREARFILISCTAIFNYLGSIFPEAGR